MLTTEDSGGGDDSGGSSVAIGPVIIDGLLCSVARAIFRQAKLEELIEAILRACDKEEIKNSWTVLFTHFKDVWCKQRNKPVIEIARTELRLMVKDIVDQLVVIEKSSDNMRLLCMPWHYIIKNLETDSEHRANLMVEEATNQVDMKLEAMEERIIKKSQDMFASIKAMVDIAVNKQQQHACGHGQSAPASYAGVTAGMSQQLAGHARGWGQEAGGAVQVRVTQPRTGARAAQGGLQVPSNPIRSRSPSIKRVKLDDGSTLEVIQDRSSSKSRSNTKKAVTGTSNTSVTGRKMRSPPADIFIYGVHPDTTEEDIVNDLADSGIMIESKDVIKKSKDDAPLKSFKISVKAEDLQKSLDPSVWPLRVKVREYIYYSRKSPRQVDGQAAASNQQQGQADRGRGQAQGQQVPDGDQQWSGVTTENRFAVLAKPPASVAEQDL